MEAARLRVRLFCLFGWPALIPKPAWLQDVNRGADPIFIASCRCWNFRRC